MLNLKKHTKRLNLNLNQQLTLRTADMCVRITVYKCRPTQHRTVVIIFSLILQRIIVAHSTGGEGIDFLTCIAAPKSQTSNSGAR